MQVDLPELAALLVSTFAVQPCQKVSAFQERRDASRLSNTDMGPPTRYISVRERKLEKFGQGSIAEGV